VSSAPSCVIDTVVLLYFLLAGEVDLLLNTLGPPRDRAATNAKRLRVVTELYRAGSLLIMDMAAEEHEIFGKATSPSGCGSYGLLFPLDPGEAACLAMAMSRDLPLVTDDGDALRALQHISPQHPYQRIRKLLIRAGEKSLITRSRANAIHRDMTALGFWDSQLPFRGEP
jgi:hypothetical protein